MENIETKEMRSIEDLKESYLTSIKGLIIHSLSRRALDYFKKYSFEINEKYYAILDDKNYLKLFRYMISIVNKSEYENNNLGNILLNTLRNDNKDLYNYIIIIENSNRLNDHFHEITSSKTAVGIIEGIKRKYISIINYKKLDEKTRLIKESQNEIIGLNKSYANDHNNDSIIKELQPNLESLEGFVFNEDQRNISYQDNLQSIINEYETKPLTPPIKSNFRDLDYIIKGFQKTRVYIIGGRPSMGKTSFIISIINNIYQKQLNNVLLFSLEMSNEEIMKKMITLNTDISYDDLTFEDGKNNDDTINKIKEYINQNQKKKNKIILNDKDTTLDGIELTSGLEIKKNNINIIFIDYLQLINLDRKNIPTYEKTTEISRRLKLLSKKLEIPIVVLCQLNRETEKRNNHIPKLSDIRDSGAVEQDADVVMFIHREDYYNDDKKRDDQTQEEYVRNKTIASIYIRKNRHGKDGKIDLHFEPKKTSFNNLDKNYSQGGVGKTIGSGNTPGFMNKYK